MENEIKHSYEIEEINLQEICSPPIDQLNPHYIQTLKDTSIHSVEVQYSNNHPNSRYTYLTRLKLKKGDVVVIETPSGHYRTVKVVTFSLIPTIKGIYEIDYKWVVSKIPIKQYKKTKKENNKIIKGIRHQQLLAQREKDTESLNFTQQTNL